MGVVTYFVHSRGLQKQMPHCFRSKTEHKLEPTMARRPNDAELLGKKTDCSVKTAERRFGSLVQEMISILQQSRRQSKKWRSEQKETCKAIKARISSALDLRPACEI